MYKSTDYEYEQLSFINFNTSCGMQLDQKNEWIQISKMLPWRAWEALYEVMFPSGTGNVAKPCRMVIGSLIIQLRMGLTDRDLVDQIRQNPYYQYFIGLLTFQHEAPFARTLLVEWRKRVDLAFVIKANDLLCDATPDAFRFRKRKGNTRYGDRERLNSKNELLTKHYIEKELFRKTLPFLNTKTSRQKLAIFHNSHHRFVQYYLAKG